MRNILLSVLGCTLLYALVSVTSVSYQAASAQSAISGDFEAMPAGGTCGGSCSPGTCGTGETRQDNCTSCSGQSTTQCKCKGNYQCYNAKGKQTSSGKCTGSCSVSKTTPELIDELLNQDGDPIRSEASSWAK